MANVRLSMRKIREVLRLCLGEGMSARQAAESCGIGRTAAREYLERVRKAGLSWPLPEELDETSLENMLFPSSATLAAQGRNMPSFDYIYGELRKKHTTLQLLWHEYRENNPDGYQYSQFCLRYREWVKTLDVTLRQEHRAGEKLFVDFAGDTIPVYDEMTGASAPAYLFVATMGASNYTYAQAVMHQDLYSWISLHVNAFRFLGAVPQITVPDNLKAGVTRPCRYEPDLNPTYRDMAAHYGTTIIPARVGKPKDKAKVESAVLIAERWIIAALRNHTFFSIEELNKAIREKLTELNAKPLQKMKVSRKELFENIDRPAMKSLPQASYEYAEWESHRVNIDYHIEAQKHFYSVPYQLKGELVETRITTRTVEIFFKGKRVAAHVKGYVPFKHTTLPEHMPESHRRYVSWTPSRIVGWAEKTGPSTGTLVKEIMERKTHPEQGFRSCLGIIRLEKHYGQDRLEAACSRALLMNIYSYKSVKSILEKKLDGKELSSVRDAPPVLHENIRGNQYFAKGETHVE